MEQYARFINITTVNILNISIYPILSYKSERISCYHLRTILQGIWQRCPKMYTDNQRFENTHQDVDGEIDGGVCFSWYQNTF